MSKVILFQGDSITDMGRSRDNESFSGVGYPTLVKAKLGYDCPGEYTFLNRGISGNRVVDLYARMKIDMINLHPAYMSILIGINDVWHERGNGNGVAAPKYEKVYNMMIEELKEELPDMKIIILEPFVLPASATVSDAENPDRWEYFHDETLLRAEAAKRVAEKNGLYFVPLQAKFDALCEKAEPSYWIGDGVHPTAMGHELIAREWIKVFNAINAAE